MNDRTRFWAKVEKTDTCWLWTAGKRGGYGHFRMGRTHKNAHRVAYEWLVGPIPEGMQIDHVCLTRACVNPAHLRVVTNKQNKENAGRARADSATGVRGVCWESSSSRWRAQVQHNGKLHQRRFVDFDEACVYVVELRNRLFTHNDADRFAS